MGYGVGLQEHRGGEDGLDHGGVDGGGDVGFSDALMVEKRIGIRCGGKERIDRR